MPIRLSEEPDSNILTIHASGKLVKKDYEQLVTESARLVEQHGKMRVLFDMADFHGWDVGGAWEDLKFGIKHFSDIERIAMVGETKWQHGLELFWNLFTKAECRYFDHADMDEARKWLKEA